MSSTVRFIRPKGQSAPGVHQTARLDKFNSRKEQRAALWRDPADAVVLLRLTSGRLNEVLRMKLDQFSWGRCTVRLYASKTENERDVPLSKGIDRVIRARVGQDLLSLNRSALMRRSVAAPSYSLALRWLRLITRSPGPASEPLAWLSSIMGKRTAGHVTAFDTRSLLTL